MSFVIGRRGQEGGGAVVGDCPFEFYSSDLGQHVASFPVPAQLLGALVLAEGRRVQGLMVGAQAPAGGGSLGSGGLELLLLLLMEQLLGQLRQILIVLVWQRLLGLWRK